tara:strand:- start:107 stop:1243 length:1137 start_codon:yes stop_codon:yes gene_type:complete
MGFFDKAIKNVIKSPLGKAALIGGLSMTPFGQAGIAKLMPLLSKGAAMPLISKPLTSAATSYGLARLMRARNPEKAALYGALTTLPFLFSSANKEALALAEKGFTGAGGKKASIWDVLLNRNVSMPGIKDIATSGSQYRIPFTMDDINPAYGNIPDPISGVTERANVLAQLNDPSITAQRYAAASQRQPNLFSNVISGKSMGAGENLNYFMKPPLGEGESEAVRTGMAALLPKTDFNVLNALVPTLAGVYGARETDAQAWDRIKKQRKQQLAFMYGVDPEDIEGEMDNPYYNIAPPALDFKYANKGGIMNLEMGGDISGPGTGTSDSINAKVSDGEFIFTEKAVTNFGGGDRQKGAQRMYAMMNQLDPQSETPQEGMV